MTSRTIKTLAARRSALLVVVWVVLGWASPLPASDNDCSSGGCHQELARLQERTATDENAANGTWANAETHLHGSVADQQCAGCHVGHAEGERPASVVRGAFPAGLYAPYSRSSYSACFDSCHAAALVEELRTTTATRFRNGDDNLHHRHVAKLRRGRSCRLCHEPHEASNEALIRDYLPFGVQRLTLKYEASDSGGKCATSCHIEVEYSRDEAIPSAMRVAEPKELQ